jgi:hypothetical protein
MISSFSRMARLRMEQRDGVKNHSRAVLRALIERALCPFHRRGKFFAQIAHCGRLAERNRSKMSESGSTDSL